MKRALLAVPVLVLFVLFEFLSGPAAAVETVSVIELEGAISPITVRLLSGAL